MPGQNFPKEEARIVCVSQQYYFVQLTFSGTCAAAVAFEIRLYFPPKKILDRAEERKNKSTARPYKLEIVLLVG